MKTLKLIAFQLAISMLAFAQTPYDMQYGLYTQNFDGLANSGSTSNLMPTGWGFYETGSNADNTYGISTGSATAGDTYSFGSANATDRALGGLLSGNVTPSYGFGFKNNTGYVLTAVALSASMEQWRVSNSVGLDSCYFYYSTNATSLADVTATWIPLSALDLYSAVNPTSGSALNGNLAVNRIMINATIPATVALGDTLFIKWVDVNIVGSDDGLAIDDVTITLSSASGPIPVGPPAIIATAPVDNATNVAVSTSSLFITLDTTIITLGTGNATLINLSNNTSVTIGSITLSGPVAILNGVVLASNTDYAVRIDSTLLMTARGPFLGIYDSTTWNFKTINTTPPAAVTMLNETFTGCADPVFGVFTAYSETGTQDWRCTTFGHNDSNAVRMNGGSATASFDNQDWLLSPPLDFSGMNAPHLHFWSKLRFYGTNTKELYVSTDYTGMGSPTAATWTALQINNWAALDTVSWKRFTNTDLTSYKSANFFIAFKYVSDTTTGADEWSIDDVLVTDGPLSIGSFAQHDFAVSVLGEVAQHLNLQTVSAVDRNLHYTLYDMTGRTITHGNLNIIHGRQQHQLSTSACNSGMYFLQLSNEQASTTVKFIVR